MKTVKFTSSDIVDNYIMTIKRETDSVYFSNYDTIKDRIHTYFYQHNLDENVLEEQVLTDIFQDYYRGVDKLIEARMRGLLMNLLEDIRPDFKKPKYEPIDSDDYGDI